MTNSERISRFDRRRNFAPLKFFLISALVLALIGLTAYKITRPKPPKTAQAQVIAPKAIPNLNQTADSIITSCCNSYYLNKTKYLQSSGSSYHRYYQDWPQEIPFVLFAGRLNNMASDAGLECDCKESPKGNWMECFIKSGSKIGAEIYLKAGIDANLLGRDIVFILRNFRALKNEEITLLIRNGVTFSYFTSPDYIPSTDLRKLMARGNVTPVLILPTSRDGWINLSRSMGIQRKAGNKKPSFDAELVDDILSKQSEARLFVFDSTSALDKDIISIVLKRTAAYKLNYLLGGPGSNRVDSLVFLSKVKIMDFSGAKATPISSVSELKFRLFRELLNPKGENQKLVLYPDMTNVSIESLWNLRVTLSNMGVRIRPLVKLVTPIK